MINFEQLIFLVEMAILLIGLAGGIFFLVRYFSFIRAYVLPSQTGVNRAAAPQLSGSYFYIFVFVQLLALGGLLFFQLVFVNSSKQAPLKSDMAAQNTEIVSTPVPTTIPDSEARAISAQIEDKFLKQLPYYNKGLLVKSSISNTYSGIIESIDFIPSEQDGMVTQIKLRGSKGYSNTLAFIEKDVRKATVEASISGQLKAIDIKDLKPGDKIRISSTIDLLGDFPENRVNLTIKKSK